MMESLMLYYYENVVVIQHEFTEPKRKIRK